MHSTLDEIVLNYVVTVLENLACETGSLDDFFDVEEFYEMLSAYFPEFEKIPHTVVTEWIFELVESLRKIKAEKKGEMGGYIGGDGWIKQETYFIPGSLLFSRTRS